jgi:hypothetical protein
MKLPALLILIFLSAMAASGQDNHIYGTVGVGANLNLPNRVPFWFRANQFGSTPLPGASGSVYGSFHKYYDTVDNPLIDWGGGLELRGDAGPNTRGTIVEGYLKAALSIFELKAGRLKETVGLADSTLSSGSFDVSGNALGIPQVELSIPQFYTIPVLKGLFAIKGSFAVGWAGQTSTDIKSSQPYNSYYHQKSFYVRLGQPGWRIHFTGGVNHQVIYGGEQLTYGSGYKLNGFQSFLHAATGKRYLGHRIGNNLGSVDMGAEIELNTVRVFLYRQSFYDQSGLFHLANLRDGLNGISLTNKEPGYGNMRWHKLVLEFLYSNDQAHLSRPAENYYNDVDYPQGWSYKGAGLGNPLLSNNLYLRFQPYNQTDRFINNRVIALHGGLDASLFNFDIRGKLTYSKNYGTFNPAQQQGTHDPSAYPISDGVGEVSGYLEVSRKLPHELRIGAAAALDYGHLLYNTAGAMLILTKSF